MPELPEVQTTVNGLNRRIRGLVVRDVWTDYDSRFHRGKDSIKDPTYFKKFRPAVKGARIVNVSRLAKNILIHIEKPASKGIGHPKPYRAVILVHMKMTGHLMYGDYDRKDPFNRFVHLIFTFDNGRTLELSDMRKFAKVTLIDESALDKSIHLEDIGPDPLDSGFTAKKFLVRLMRKPTGKIKQVLMDQSVIAGIGNIYSDEALWRAGIHPEERVKDIPPPLMKKLYEETVKVLKSGIDFGGDSMSDYRNIDGKRGKFQEHHRAYRKTGERCSLIVDGKRCTGTITRKKVGGRSAHFCNVHQKLGASLQPTSLVSY
ncbi:MAG: DNA-formamidopyrimidine glycosylase [Patescibacteria group bacterium]|nr:DNA-formamidopyrimidine glycosylase [Patescibacteria group bacterium]